jgi:hypothetical protein
MLRGGGLGETALPGVAIFLEIDLTEDFKTNSY